MAGSIHPTLAGHLAEAMRLLRRRLRRRLERIRRRPDPERVHQLRVEARRALALVDLVRGAGLTRGTRKLRRWLKGQLDAFDEVRDLHICGQRVRQWLGDEPESERLAGFWAEEERRLADEVVRGLDPAEVRRREKRLKKLQKRLKKAAAEGSEEPVSVAAVRVLEPLFVRVEQRARHVKTPAGIHRLRVAFKRYRYACETLASFLPGLSAPVLAGMRDFHGLMGELQDLQVLRAALRRDGPRLGIGRARLRALQGLLARREIGLVGRCQVGARRLGRWRPSGLARRRAR